MSKDLLIDLDAFYSPPAQEQPGKRPQESFSFFDDVNSKAQKPQQFLSQTFGSPLGHDPFFASAGVPSSSPFAGNVGQEEDDWGDFEDAKPSTTARGANTSTPFSTIAQKEQRLRPQLQQLDSFDIISGNFNKPPLGPSVLAGTNSRKPAPKAGRPPRDPNVLFDADEDQYDDDDDFGDFEDANPSEAAAAPKAQPQSQPQQQVRQVSQNLLDLDFGGPTSSTKPEPPPPWQAQSQISTFRAPDVPRSNHPTQPPEVQGNVFDDDDPWSDFGGGVAKPETRSHSNPLADVATAGSESRRNKTSMWGNFPSDRSQKVTSPKRPPGSTPKQKPLSPAARENADDDAWDDFDTTVPTQPQPPQPISNTTPQSPSPLPDLPTILSESTSTPSLPPTNIPPPSLILSLFPPLIATAQSSFFNPLSNLSSAARTLALSYLSTHEFLKAYLALSTVAARLIAGRKLRWKRDGRLAQGMRIGAAGGTGMKLAGVDRAEPAREEREVEEVVRLWREQVGRVRSAVVQVNSFLAKSEGESGQGRQATALGAVPELKETMGVKTAKETEGGVPSRRPCALCGLKREERVVGVENEVDDVFEEWWVESCSMHRWCANFWEGQGDKLRSR